MDTKTELTSVIVTSQITNTHRRELFASSLTSLISSVKSLPVEIVVVGMGGNDDSWLNGLLEMKMISCYIKNATNLSFGIGRNQGYAVSSGKYICIADNDILYHPGWLASCLTILKKYPKKKLYSSCIEYPTGFLKQRYDVGKLDGYNLNMRAGSNCFVVRRDYYDEIGGFMPHRIAGTKWTDRACKLGFVCAVSPFSLCEDMGLRDGYNHHEPIGFKKILTNGEEIYLNKDEFNERNPELVYV